MCFVSLPLIYKRLALLAFVTMFCVLPASAQGNSKVDQVLKDLRRGNSYGQLALSPDGKKLAWIERTQAGLEIRVAPLEHLSTSERVTAATSADLHCNEGQITWAPDSAELGFFSDCASQGQTDAYVTKIGSHESARRLTKLTGYADDAAFSPDGKKIAFLYVENATRSAGALAAMKPPAGVIGEDGVEIQRVAQVDVDVATPMLPTQVTPAKLHVYEFSWSPDAKSLAYIAAYPPGENNWWVAKLYTQHLGDEPHAVLAPAEVSGPLHDLQIAVPRWSPDGQKIAFIGGLMSDQGSTGGDVWVIPAAGGDPRNLTTNWKTTQSWIEWLSSDRIFASSIAGGDSQLQAIDVTGRGEHPAKIYARFPGTVADGRWSMSASPSYDHSLFVFQSSSFDKAPELYALHLDSATEKDLAQLTRLNNGVAPAWGKSISLDWKDDAFDVQGWLLQPANYDATKHYPLVVVVHGGPAAAVQSRWGSGGGISATALSAMGYFVLQVNPRGSFGQGEAFTQANRKDFGYGDLRDILAGVDTVLKKYPVDPARVGITGWSYGGFMTMFTVTQTNRFKAAVAGAGISNWQSYYGENSIDQWMTPYFGASVYDDPKVYAKSSAINFIHQAKTPTLIVVGDRDGECPAPQSYEMWHALRDLHVPTQLVVYPNEGHGFVSPEHRKDVLERTLDWFSRYMPATAE